MLAGAYSAEGNFILDLLPKPYSVFSCFLLQRKHQSQHELCLVGEGDCLERGMRELSRVMEKCYHLDWVADYMGVQTYQDPQNYMHIYNPCFIYQVFASFLNLYVDILTPSGVVLGSGAFGGWLGYEDGTLLNGIKCHYKTQENLLPLSALCNGEYNEKMATSPPGSGPPPGTGSAGPLILDFQTSRTVRN